MFLIFLIVLKSLVIFVCVALAVGFYTLLERKVLSYVQMRKGPNKVGFMGFPQPLADAVKLFSKENLSISISVKFLYILSPVGAAFIMFVLWSIYTSIFSCSLMNLTILFFIVVSSVNVYSILLSGWSSNSKYSLLGSVRAVAQTISYEISMSLVLMSVLLLTTSFSSKFIFFAQHPFWFSFSLSFVCLMWFITALAETNRAPFDLAEGESELVSGFNTEYGGGEFALLFIAEYGSILLISILSSCLFFKGFYCGVGVVNSLKMLFFCYLFLWVRASYPRMRYDTLMSLTWKTFLILSIVICMLLFTFSV